jgi:multisubunit Na+/H+ antiporter MnhC subunit
MALALTFIVGGLGLTALSIYFYKKMKEEEQKKS